MEPQSDSLANRQLSESTNLINREDLAELADNYAPTEPQDITESGVSSKAYSNFEYFRLFLLFALCGLCVYVSYRVFFD